MKILFPILLRICIFFHEDIIAEVFSIEIFLKQRLFFLSKISWSILNKIIIQYQWMPLEAMK